MKTSQSLDAALDYAKHGLAVVPLHTVTNGRCSCVKDAACSSPGKHPRTLHGFADATSDADVIREWFAMWPDANVGIRTGDKLCVVDVDRHKADVDGMESFAAICSAHDYVPLDVPQVATGGGGWHYFFQVNGAKTTTCALGAGLELKAADAGVVAPPSIHESGKPYEWLSPLPNDLRAVPKLPPFFAAAPKTAARATADANEPTVDPKILARIQAIDDEELLRKIAASGQGDKFTKLFGEGDNSDYATGSEADFALCGILAWWTGKDASRVERLFQSSALGKLERIKPGEARRTAERACRATTSYWTPGNTGYRDLSDLADGKAAKVPAAEPLANPQADLCTQSLNDYGNAQRLIAVYGNDLRFCTPMKKFFIWDGRRWLIDERDEIRKLAQQVFLTFAAQAMNAGNDQLTRFAGACLNSQRISSAIREAQPLLAVGPDELDTNGWLLNFQNGTVDLRTGLLREHRREDLITKIIHHNYDPAAACPQFLAFLDRSVGALVPFVQKAIGYSVTGITSEKTNFLCMGLTDTGKTTLLNLLRDALINEYAALILIDALMQSHEDNNSRADLADLRGVRFAMTSETEEGQRLREV